jgi:drug/metabolite transporter (DMT)-like permease
MQINKTDSLKGIIFACTTAVLWGILAIALKISLNHLSPVDITWFRFTLAFIGLAFFYYFKKPTYLKILRRPPLLLIIASLCLAVNYYGFIEGVNLTSPSIAQIFIQTGPVLLALSGFIFFKEKLLLRQMLGLLIVITGLVFFYREHMNLLQNNFKHYQTGIIWVLTAALMWAIYTVFIKMLIKKYPPMQLNLVIFGLPAMMYLPLVNFSGFLYLTFIDWLIIVFLGLNTLIAYGTLSLAIKYIEANKVSVIIILNPVLTFIIMGIISSMNVSWVQKEHFSLAGLLGGFIVLVGAILTILQPSRK